MPAVLTLLRIRNLALVEDLEWELAPGFVAVTGETGAGKSIIIGALQLLLGERADKSLIRTGAEQCTVEAIFSGPDLPKLNRTTGRCGRGIVRWRVDRKAQFRGEWREPAIHQRFAHYSRCLENARR